MTLGRRLLVCVCLALLLSVAVAHESDSLGADLPTDSLVTRDQLVWTPPTWQSVLNALGLSTLVVFLNALSTNVTSVRTLVNQHTSRIAALESQLASMQSLLDAHSVVLSQHTSAIAQLQSTTVVQGVTVQQNTAQIVLNSDSINAHSTQLLTMDSSIQTHDSYLHVLDSSLSYQRDRLDSVGSTKHVKFIHANDFYNIEGLTPAGTSSPIGGISRGVTFRKQHPDAIGVFSGDAFFPSLLSYMTNAAQMVWALNQLNLTVAVVGTNEVMQGKATAEALFRQCNFRWLSANLVNADGSQLLANTTATYVLNHPSGLRIGFVGLSSDVTGTLGTGVFLDPVTTARKYAAILKNENHCDLVVAITHENFPVDLSLLTAPNRVDFVLGGQDFFNYSRFGDSLILRDGVQLNHMSIVEMSAVNNTMPLIYRTEVYTQALDSTIPQDTATQAVVQTYLNLLPSTFFDPLVLTTVDLNAEQADLRIQETNVGNYFVEALWKYWNATQIASLPAAYPHIAILPGGTLRVDDYIVAGTVITQGFVMSALPSQFRIVMIQITGSILRAALEQAVFILPKAKFPQIAGFKFVMNPLLPGGGRILSISLSDGTPIVDTDNLYLTINSNQRAGGNGYTMFTTPPLVLGPSAAFDVDIVIRQMQIDGAAHGHIAPFTDGRISRGE